MRHAPRAVRDRFDTRSARDGLLLDAECDHVAVAGFAGLTVGKVHRPLARLDDRRGAVVADLSEGVGHKLRTNDEKRGNCRRKQAREPKQMAPVLHVRGLSKDAAKRARRPLSGGIDQFVPRCRSGRQWTAGKSAILK
jgi:hypothetical protein